MTVVETLLQLGGVATRGEVVVLARGRYVLPAVDVALRAAHRVAGVVSHRSAALSRGWGVKTVPDLPDVTVPRNRRLTTEQRQGVDLHRGEHGPDDVVAGVTSRDRTLVDCLRGLPFDEALCVADSALREGYPHAGLVALTRDLRGPGSRQAREVAARADGKSANPFESVLRAICGDLAGLEVRPQVPLYGADFLGCPDLVDPDLRIVIEADSFAWHGDRAALHRDTRRYNGFAVHGWLVLRFAWEDVMDDPSYVRFVYDATQSDRGSVAE